MPPKKIPSRMLSSVIKALSQFVSIENSPLSHEDSQEDAKNSSLPDNAMDSYGTVVNNPCKYRRYKD